MFGFGDSKERAEEEQRKAKEMREGFMANAMIRTFGTSDPKAINKIWRMYMPEITNAILETKAATLNTEQGVATVTKNQLAIHEDLTKNSNEKHDELLIRLDSLEKQNKELQEKYNAMVERMARYIEKENGKGR